MMDGDGQSEMVNKDKDGDPNYQERTDPDVPEGHQSKLLSELFKGKDLRKNRDTKEGEPETSSACFMAGGSMPEKLTPKPRRSSRKRVSSRYVDSEDLVNPLEDQDLWSPALSRALQERYGRGRKRTPRTLTRLMQQHRENERHRHHGLNASIREISQRIPGFDEQNKETKIVKLQRIINYICHLETNIKSLCDMSGFALDYKNLFLSPHICKNADDWKVTPKMTSNLANHEAHKAPSPVCLKPHLEKKADPAWEDGLLANSPSVQNRSSRQNTRKQSEQLGSKSINDPQQGSRGSGHPTSEIREASCEEPSPGTATDDLLPLMLQGPDEAAVDFTWLDHMMTPDLDHMCPHVDELPDLLPGDLSDLSHADQVFAGDDCISDGGVWQKCENFEQDFSNVALIHSYVKPTPSTTTTTTTTTPISTCYPDQDEDDTDEESANLPCVRPLDVPHHVLTDLPELTDPSSFLASHAVDSLPNLEKSCNSTLAYGDTYYEPSNGSCEEMLTQISELEEDGKLGVVFGQVSPPQKKMKPLKPTEKRENPGVHPSIISSLMGEDWRKLGYDKQQPYREKARIFATDHLTQKTKKRSKKKGN